jgi:hypothetical protein
MAIEHDGQRWSVKLTKEPIGGGDRDDQAFLGRSDEVGNTIVIDGTLPETRQGEVFLHELVHIASDFLMPESMVRQIGANLFGILSTNDLLVGDFLSKSVDGRLTKAETDAINRDSQKAANEPALIFMRNVDEGPWDGGVPFEADREGGYNATLKVWSEDGRINRTAAHQAAAVLTGASQPLKGTRQQHRAAANKLVTVYREMGEEPSIVLVGLSR